MAVVGQLPDYGRLSLAELLPSVCDSLRVPGGWDHLGLGDARRVVLVLVDGLGHLQLQEHADLAPTMAAADRGPVTSVFPSTTPTALTSLGTGLPPGGHGLMGAVFRYRHKPFAPLGWRDTPSARAMQPEPTWWERAAHAGVRVSNVGPRAHRGGGLTDAAFRGAHYCAADTVGERVAEIAAAAARGSRSLVYGYWEGLDKTGHVHGVDSPHYRAELVAVEQFVVAVAAALAPGTRLIVTADHGIVDCDTSVAVDTPDLLDGVDLLAGEPRMRQAYTAAGRFEAVIATWRRSLAGAAAVLSREEAIRAGVFGPVSPEFADRIGDVLAIAHDGVRLTAHTRDALLSNLRGQHGALTPAEMLVPLSVLDL